MSPAAPEREASAARGLETPPAPRAAPEPLAASLGPPERSPRTNPHRWPIAALLKLTCDLLDMDLAMLTQVSAGREEVRRAAGAWPGIAPEGLSGASLPLSETFCQRLLEGQLPPYITDVALDPSAANLTLAQAFGVGAWIGARIPAHGAQLYVLCCLARTPRPLLDHRQVRTIATLAGTLAGRIENASLTGSS